MASGVGETGTTEIEYFIVSETENQRVKGRGAEPN